MSVLLIFFFMSLKYVSEKLTTFYTVLDFFYSLN